MAGAPVFKDITLFVPLTYKHLTEMKKRLFLSLVAMTALMLFIAVPTDTYAQGRNRNYIKERIDEHGECRNVAITKRNGDLMLYGENGWAASGCPKGLTDALRKLNDEGEYINDVQLTENGCWLILYGNNGIRYNDIPYSLEKKLREWNNKKEVITSVSFNDDGDWIAVSENYISASDSEIQDFISEGMDSYGGVWATCITDDAIVVVYEEGYRTVGNIPSTLMAKLKSTSINVYRLKIAGESWFISDGKSQFDYNM